MIIDTAFAQNPELKEWCRFNDSHVSSVNDPNAVRVSPSFLFSFSFRILRYSIISSTLLLKFYIDRGSIPSFL